MNYAKYMNPFTDFGFKKLFGEPANSDLLIDFLNQIIDKEDAPIVSLNFLTPQQLGRSKNDKSPVYDLYCETKTGDRFIIEMQNAPQTYFIDRTIYYASFPIQNQGKKGDWDYKLSKVYTIGILNFTFKDDDVIKTNVGLYDYVRQEKFYKGIHFIYLEMPKFTKALDALETRFDKWMYVLTQLSRLERMPEKLKEEIFTKVFEIAELAAMPKNEYAKYRRSLRCYWDTVNVMRTAEKNAMAKGYEDGRTDGYSDGHLEGLKEGRAEGRAEGLTVGENIGREKTIISTYKKLLERGLSQDDMLQILDISQNLLDEILVREEARLK